MSDPYSLLTYFVRDLCARIPKLIIPSRKCGHKGIRRGAGVISAEHRQRDGFLVGVGPLPTAGAAPDTRDRALMISTGGIPRPQHSRCLLGGNGGSGSAPGKGELSLRLDGFRPKKRGFRHVSSGLARGLRGSFPDPHGGSPVDAFFPRGDVSQPRPSGVGGSGRFPPLPRFPPRSPGSSPARTRVGGTHSQRCPQRQPATPRVDFAAGGRCTAGTLGGSRHPGRYFSLNRDGRET